MKTGLFAAAACAAALAAVSAATPTLTPEQALDRRTIADVEISPDGARVVFTVAEPAKGTSRARALWLLDIAANRTRPLTFSGKNDSAPQWSPDGRWIAFLSDRDGAPQLFRLPLAGGEAEKLTDRKDAISAFRWSPDGSRIALLMAEPKSEAEQQRERDKDDARVVDKERRRPRLWLLDVATRDLNQITVGTWRIDDFEWLRSGEGFVAVATSSPASDQWTERLYTVSLSGTFKEIAAPKGPIGDLAVSPDGSMLAYLGARVDGPDAHDLYTVPIGGGAARNMTAASIDRPIGRARWIDRSTIAATVAKGFNQALATIDANGAATFVDGLEVNPNAYARSKDGTMIYAGETATRAPELWVKAPGAPARAVTTVNQQWASIPVVAPEFIKYKSFDGTEIEAALLSPQQPATSHQQLPLVVLVHGGPTGRWVNAFEAWGQLLAARGYAVLYPNVRGSTGYGERFVEMNRADWGGGDFKDVMAVVDWAVARGIADANRLGIGGWSYGGYMAAWAVTQTNRFKAAVAGAPVIDLASEFGTEDGSAYDEWFYGTPYEQLDGFVKSSPITYVKRAQTPTLLLQGESDVTDPIGQSQQFYRGLKRYGVATELVLYPREGHGLREEKHLVDRLARILAWYDRHLKPAS